MQSSGERISARDGTDEEFDPSRQAQYALESERLHEGLASESLIAALLLNGPESSEPLELAKSEEDRRLLAAILMHEEEELTPETVEGAIRGLRRISLRRRLEDVQRSLVRSGVSKEDQHALLQERIRLKRALADPGVDEAAGRAS
jgi:hypothetical protein